MMGNFDQKHPERKSHEVFVSNADDSTFLHMKWDTKRKGNVAYFRSGELVGSRWCGAYPVFVNRCEIDAKNPKMLAFLDADEEWAVNTSSEHENLKRAQLRLLNARMARAKLEEKHAEAYKEWCEAMQDYESAVRGYMADIMSRGADCV